MGASLGIFIRYCPEDAVGPADALRAELTAWFGEESFPSDRLFEYGAFSNDAIERAIGSIDVLIVVIGKDWLTATDVPGRRLDDRQDFFRLEIEAALRLNVHVIPVLLDGATMPPSQRLPEEIRDLGRLQALEIRDAAWGADVRRLIEAVEAIRGGPTRVPAGQSSSLPTAEREGQRLARLLRDAALRGVIPKEQTVSAAATPAVAPARPAPEFRIEPEEWRVPATRKEAPLTMSSPLLWIAAAFAMVGGAVAAARWLLDWFIVPSGPRAASDLDLVDCTVFAPSSASPGDSILVQAFVHFPAEAEEARAIAMELDVDTQRRAFRSLELGVMPSDRIEFELRLPGLEIDQPVTSLVWRGRAEAVQFAVRIPPNTQLATVIGTLAISLESAPVGHVKFKLAIDATAYRRPDEPQGEQARRFESAFISYASTDRDEVLRRLQVLPLVGVNYFQDVLNLEPGDRWLRKIEFGIESCDLFLLFWSSGAKRSEWVRKEVQYALTRQGGDEMSLPEIRPVILENEPFVEPWEELGHLHFNDRTLYLMSGPPRIPLRSCRNCGHRNRANADFCGDCGDYLRWQ